MKGHRLNKRQPLSEAIKQQAKLHAKYKEYSEKTTEELTEMLSILGGGYKAVCIEILRERKLKELQSNQVEEIPEGEV